MKRPFLELPTDPALVEELRREYDRNLVRANRAVGLVGLLVLLYLLGLSQWPC